MYICSILKSSKRKEHNKMNDKELERIIDYLKNEKGWSDEEIVKLLHYIASGKTK